MRSSLTSAIFLAFAAIAAAAPALSPRAPRVQADAQCDLSKVQLPLVPGLPAPSAGLVLSHVAIGRGTQNYTCDLTNNTAIPKANGAKATLYNVTCLSASPQNLVASLPGLALKMAVPAAFNNVADDTIAALTSGHHFFTNATTPFFDFQSGVAHNYGSVAAAKTASAPAPENATKGEDGSAAVAWLQLTGFLGDYQEVYRVDTAGGSPPATCQGQSADIEVPYSAAYYFYKSA